MTDGTLQAWRLLLTAHAELVEVLSNEMAEESGGLPLTWYEVLLLLYEAKGRLRMHELADSLLLSRSATTRFVDRMVEAGLVEREAVAGDRRGVAVALTDDGRRVFAEAAPRHVSGIRRHFSAHVTEEEAAVMVEVLQRVLVALRDP
jgi:DNA-binding MarR family transcriptional regulator